MIVLSRCVRHIGIDSCPRILGLLVVFVCLCVRPCFSIDLLLAGIPSLFEQDSVVLVFSDDLNMSEAEKVSNYSLSPDVAVVSASVSSVAGNVVTLKLRYPLDVGSAVVTVKSGLDAHGGVISRQQLTFNVVTVQSACERILSCQLPNGAINVYGPPSGGFKPTSRIRVVPYFSCQAALGLISGWQMTGNAAYLESVRDYLAWHESHFNADGTIYDYGGTVAEPVSTGDYDSTDSYGALYLMVLWRYYIATGDYGFVASRWDSVQKAVAGMLLTLQDDELTWAQPEYKIKYTMDNSEVFQGCFAAAQLARVAGHDTEYRGWLEQSRLTRDAMLTKLWSGTHYYYYLGDTTSTAQKYYPYGMATDMATVYIDKTDSGNLAKSRTWVTENFMPGFIPASDVSMLSVWSAQRAGDDFEAGVLMTRCMDNLFNAGYISPSVGTLLQIAAENSKRPLSVLSHPVASHLPDASKIPTDSPVTGHLWLHPFGLMVGASNRSTYVYPSNTLDADGSVLLGFSNCGSKLYVSVDAYDKYITSAYEEIDSDGLSHLNIRDAGKPTVFHRVGLTFSETSDMPIVTAPTPRGMLASMPAENYSFALKPGNNTINNASDIDTGFTMELCIDLSSEFVGRYSTSISPLDVTFGVRYANMNGTPFMPWPWSDGAEGTIYQLNHGTQDLNYSVDVLRLIDMKPARCESYLSNKE